MERTNLKTRGQETSKENEETEMRKDEKIRMKIVIEKENKSKVRGWRKRRRMKKVKKVNDTREDEKLI